MLAAVVAFGTAAAACGGGGMSLENWAAEANEVCADFQREAERAIPGYSGLPVDRAVELNADLAVDELRALRDLGRPGERGDETSEWLDVLNRRAGALQTWTLALDEAGGASPGEPVPQSVLESSIEAAELAAELGLDLCGGGVEVARAGPGGLPAPSYAAPGGGSVPGEADAPAGPGPAPGEAPPETGVHGIPPDQTVTQDQ